MRTTAAPESSRTDASVAVAPCATFLRRSVRTLARVSAILFAVVASAEDTARIFMGIDTDDRARATFAMAMISRTLNDPRLSDSAPAARLFVLGEGFGLLVAGRSPIEQKVADLVEARRDFEIVACGKAVPKMREYLGSGQVTLIAGVRLAESCDRERGRLVDQGWLEVEIPASF